jgi:hypothetical protein
MIIDDPCDPRNGELENHAKCWNYVVPFSAFGVVGVVTLADAVPHDPIHW